MTDRRSKAALLVGIDAYRSSMLDGCVADALTLSALLSTNGDGSSNFHCITMLAPRNMTSRLDPIVTRISLRDQLLRLFSRRVHVALFYFAGHGLITDRGGILLTQDAERLDEGITMEEILHLVSRVSRAECEEIVIILDCCHSGKFGEVQTLSFALAHLREGVSILASSSPGELAGERGQRGVFTSLVCEALDDGGADLMGIVTAASVYAYVDQALGAWDQRPMFKVHLARLSPLRTCRPAIPLELLQRLIDYFPTTDLDYALDPSYDNGDSNKTCTDKNPEKERIFAHLQRLRAARLVVPVGEEHMYWAAINSRSCRLTPLGRFYWRLANEKKL